MALARPVAFSETVGDMHDIRRPDTGEKACDQGRRANAIDIIVADSSDAFARHDRPRQAIGTLFHVHQRRRLRHRPSYGGIEIVFDIIEDHGPRRQHAAQKFRQVVLLGDRLGIAAEERPRPPKSSFDGTAHAQERWRGIRCQG